MPIPIIASDMTITNRSIVSHVGMRFAGWVIACPSASHVMYRKSASGCERVHMFEQPQPASPPWHLPDILSLTGTGEPDIPGLSRNVRQGPWLCENVKSRQGQRIYFSDAAAPQFSMLLTLPERAFEGILFSAACSALRFYTAKTRSRHQGRTAAKLIFAVP
jgi:hypothetical protein